MNMNHVIAEDGRYDSMPEQVHDRRADKVSRCRQFRRDSSSAVSTLRGSFGGLATTSLLGCSTHCCAPFS